MACFLFVFDSVGVDSGHNRVTGLLTVYEILRGWNIQFVEKNPKSNYNACTETRSSDTDYTPLLGYDAINSSNWGPLPFKSSHTMSGWMGWTAVPLLYFTVIQRGKRVTQRAPRAFCFLSYRRLWHCQDLNLWSPDDTVMLFCGTTWKPGAFYFFSYHPLDVSPTWLNLTCGKCSWLGNWKSWWTSDQEASPYVCSPFCQGLDV